MSFVEIEFLFFLPPVFLLYWLGPQRGAWQNSVLLVASYLFYASWHWKLLSLIVLGTALDFAIARYLDTEPTQRPQRGRRIALGISLAFSLGALGFFKYEDFFAAQANTLLSSMGLAPSVPLLHLLLPLGISYYTLQRVGYVLDVYWGRQRASRSGLQFAVFCAYFPQLTAGPIARGRELLPQFAESRQLTAQSLADGAIAFLTGYALKAWASATIGTLLVDPVFANPDTYSAMSHWAAVTGFAFQVFGDFAGYSLMAIGVSRLFGIELPINFDFPFLSTSLPDLWRRWHITLNRWLFDYIFTPLTTSNGWFRGRIQLALLLTFLGSGFWHGASWTFIAWGLLHGFGMIVQYRWDEFYKSLCRRDKSYVKKRRSLVYQLAAWALTVGFFVITLIPFRAPSAESALEFGRAMIFSPGSQSIPVGPTVLLSIALVVCYHALQLPVLRRIRDGFFTLPSPVRGAAYGLAIAFLVALTPIGSGTFIYQQF